MKMNDDILVFEHKEPGLFVILRTSSDGKDIVVKGKGLGTCVQEFVICKDRLYFRNEYGMIGSRERPVDLPLCTVCIIDNYVSNSDPIISGTWIGK
jgi:hypothetical protein